MSTHQLVLPMARRTDPATSHRAARSVRAKTIRELHQTIVAVLAVEGPLCDEALYQRLQSYLLVTPSGARTRRSECVRAGLVEDSGRRGLTSAGRPTILWRVTHAADPL